MVSVFAAYKNILVRDTSDHFFRSPSPRLLLLDQKVTHDLAPVPQMGLSLPRRTSSHTSTDSKTSIRVTGETRCRCRIGGSCTPQATSNSCPILGISASGIRSGSFVDTPSGLPSSSPFVSVSCRNSSRIPRLCFWFWPRQLWLPPSFRLVSSSGAQVIRLSRQVAL